MYVYVCTYLRCVLLRELRPLKGEGANIHPCRKTEGSKEHFEADLNVCPDLFDLR